MFDLFEVIVVGVQAVFFGALDGRDQLADFLAVRPVGCEVPSFIHFRKQVAAGDIDTTDAQDSTIPELFDLDDWAATATTLGTALAEAERRLDTETDAVVTGFTLAAASLRQLARDPQLPLELQPPGWPADALRDAYARYEASYQQLLRAFFRSIV